MTAPALAKAISIVTNPAKLFPSSSNNNHSANSSSSSSSSSTLSIRPTSIPSSASISAFPVLQDNSTLGGNPSSHNNGDANSSSSSTTAAGRSLSSASSSSSLSSSSSSSSGRLLIVANRLPVSMTIKKSVPVTESSSSSNKDSGKSEISFSSSAGGLVSALAGTDLESYWIGWPGGEVKSKEDRKTVIDKLAKLKSIPVFLTTEICNLFYNGFCNDLLWPLFHYIPLPIDAIKQHDQQFLAYEKANVEFAKVVLENYHEGDIVWVHDYHLMLLPSILRRKRPAMKIGFFFHTPFPSSEIYRVIPSRGELLHGVLSSNLLGFHTHDYSRHFQSAATRIIGAQCSNEQVKVNGAISSLGTFPIGIDPKRFVDALETDIVKKHFEDLTSQFAGRKVLLGIDRLDYIKGIPQKLHALELFLDRHPQWIGKVVLVQIAIPSRTDVLEYQRLKTSTHELVGRINGRFGSVASVPIHYLDQSIPFDKMCALYRVADAMVITSIRDGMNLVAYEYIACQNNHDGVLILSEFAGAAQSLGAGSLPVNPWNISEVADAIEKALTMSSSERRTRTEYCFNHVMTHTAKEWAREFVKELEQLEVRSEYDAASTSSPASITGGAAAVPEQNNQMKSIMPAPLDIEDLKSKFISSKHRLIITGLAGLLNTAKQFSTVNCAVGSINQNQQKVEEVHIQSNYEESAGELWGWKEASPSGSGSAANSTSATNKAAGSSSSSSAAAVASKSGPSRYSAYRRRPSVTISSDQHGYEELIEINQAHHSSTIDHEENADVADHDPTAAEVKQAIIILASDPNTTYLLLTSRTRDWCDSLFENMSEKPSNLWFAAENGYFFKHGISSHSESRWHVMYENVDLSWMEGVNRVMTYFCERTPRSWIQIQETSMQWHYGDAEPIFAHRQALDLITHLTGGPLSNTATEVLNTANIVQVRPLAVSKGRALKHLINYLTKKYKKLHQQQIQQNSNRIDANSINNHLSQLESSEEDDDQAGFSAAGHILHSHHHRRNASGPGNVASQAAMQSALNESGNLVATDGENEGYEEDDEGEDESIVPSKKDLKGLRSRRPSFGDEAAAADSAARTGTTVSTSGSASHPGSSLPSSSWSAVSNLSPVSPSSASSSSSMSSYLPLDFVLCIGSFLERDEDIFPGLNEWSDTQELPLALSTASTIGSTVAQQQSAASSTPVFSTRRISITQLKARAQSPARSPIHLSPPQLTVSPTDMVSPASEPVLNTNPGLPSGINHIGSIAIYTVTVGAKLSRARYYLPDLNGVNQLIILLAKQQQSIQPQPTVNSIEEEQSSESQHHHTGNSHLIEDKDAVDYSEKHNDQQKEKEPIDADKSNHQQVDTEQLKQEQQQQIVVGGGKDKEPTMHS